MLQYFLPDDELSRLRQRQRHLRATIDDYAALDLPLPSLTGWSDTSRRMVEVGLRSRCELEIEASVDLLTQMESNQFRDLVDELVSSSSLHGSASGDSRHRAAEILHSVPREARRVFVDDESIAMLRRLAYLLDAADAAATVS